jgi:two-component system cell cycle sensor histidine kinase/response regulator CckA
MGSRTTASSQEDEERASRYSRPQEERVVLTVTTTRTPLRVLYVEDSAADAELVLHELTAGGYDVTVLRVETADGMRAALETQTWHLVLSDYSLPTFSGPEALALLHDTGIQIPFLIISGTIGEETAVAALKAGACDFLVKNRLARLIPAIARELREVELRRARATTQAALEEQLRHAQKMEAIGQLAGGIAHDFNNLLTAILGYSELVTEQIGPDKPISQDLQEIVSAGQRAAALTRQLLAFSRKQVLSVAPLNLNQVIQGIHAMLSRLIEERIAITIDLAADLPAVLADASQLEQILLNLSVNARDAMPQGGALTIRTALAEPNDAPVSHQQGSVLLTVTDTGVGMSRDIQAKIFEPFFTTKEVGHGTGLGLAAVHGIVTQLGGTIDVESSVGQGTTFRIYLPATLKAVPQQTASARQGLQVGAETILLVEDEHGVRAFIRQALRRVGYRVIEAESAEAALELAEQEKEPIHLLLTDVMLPKLGGRELAKRLEQSRPGIHVLFISGYTEEMSTANGFLEPGVQLIAKPFSVRDLLTKIREQLDARAS